jgi:hypothetical protein
VYFKPLKEKRWYGTTPQSSNKSCAPITAASVNLKTSCHDKLAYAACWQKANTYTLEGTRAMPVWVESSRVEA